MGLFNRKSETPSIGKILNMSDSDLKKLIKSGKVPQRTPKELKEAAKVAKRAGEGEKGVGALIAGARGGGTKNRNYENVPLKDRVHPAEYKRILDREAKKQGLL